MKHFCERREQCHTKKRRRDFRILMWVVHLYINPCNNRLEGNDCLKKRMNDLGNHVVWLNKIDEDGIMCICSSHLKMYCLPIYSYKYSTYVMLMFKVHLYQILCMLTRSNKLKFYSLSIIILFRVFLL